MFTDREQKVVKWMEKRKVATMRHLRYQFQISHMTVIRALKKYGYYAVDGLKCPHPAVATLARAWEIGRTAHALSSVATVIWKGLHQTVETARSFSGKNTFAKTAANNRLATTPTPDNRGSGKR